MNARDDLIAILHQEATADRVKNSPLRDVPVVAAKLAASADAILAAGYRRPRVVTTVAELDALPVGSILWDVDGDVCQRFRTGWRATINEPNDDPWLSDTLEVDLPATVLHEPEADQ